MKLKHILVVDVDWSYGPKQNWPWPYRPHLCDWVVPFSFLFVPIYLWIELNIFYFTYLHINWLISYLVMFIISVPIWCVRVWVSCCVAWCETSVCCMCVYCLVMCTIVYINIVLWAFQTGTFNIKVQNH